MPYKLKKKQLSNTIRNAVSAARNGGAEVCGLIIDTGYFLELTQVTNKVKTGGGFAFYMKEISRIEQAVKALKYNIVGTFHSHPYYIAKPSDSDIQDCEDNELMLVIDCQDKEAILWKIKAGKPRKSKYELI